MRENRREGKVQSLGLGVPGAILVLTAVLVMTAGLAVIVEQGLLEYCFQFRKLHIQQNQYVAQPVGSVVPGLLVLLIGALMMMFAASAAAWVRVATARRTAEPAPRIDPGTAPAAEPETLL